MKANTAAGMILCGSALMLLSLSSAGAKTRLIASTLAGLVIVLGASMLIEYLGGADFRFDQALPLGKSTETIASHPDRVPLVSALSFLLTGSAMVILSLPRGGRIGPPFVAAAGVAVVASAVLAVVGFVMDELFGVRWWNYTGMALHTGVSFGLLGAGLIERVRSKGEIAWTLDPFTTTGFAVGVATLLATAGLSFTATSKLQEHSTGVSHTQEVLKEIQAITTEVVELQSTQRGYIIAPEPLLLDRISQATTSLYRHLAIVRQLTGDNPRQQVRLDQVSTAVAGQINWVAESATTVRQGDAAPAAEILADGAGVRLVERIREDLRAMEAEEYSLLLMRQNEANRSARTAFLILPLGVFLSIAMLLFGVFFLNAGAREQARAEKALRESEARYRTLFHYAPNGILIADPKGYYLDANTSTCRMLGYTHDELIRLHSSDIVAPVELQHIEPALEVLNARSDYQRQWQFRRKDGSFFAAEVIATALPDANILAMIRDITERKEAVLAMEESEKRFRTMADSMPQLAWIAGADGVIFWFNQRWYEYTGTTPDQMKDGGWQRVHDPALLPEVARTWQAAIDTCQPMEIEFPLRGADGRYRNFLARVQPLKDSQGNVVQWFGTNTDVDLLKRMEDSLRTTQTRLVSALAAGAIGTWTWDLRADCLVADEFTARAFLIKPDEAEKGLPAVAYLRAIVLEDQLCVSEALTRAIESCGSCNIEYRVQQPNGEPLWLQARGRVESDSNGKALSFHGAVVDITSRKQAEGAVSASEEHFRFLNDLAKRTRTLIDTAEIVSVMTAMLGKHLRVSRCVYAEIDKGSGRCRVISNYTDNCKSIERDHELPLFGASKEAMVNRGQAFVIPNMDTENLPTEGEMNADAMGIKAVITCPLVKAGVLYAMMAVHQTTPRDWKPGEITIVQEVVERCWAAVERRTSEEKIRQLNVELEHRVEERTEQLEKANLELEAFSYSVSHDLRAPLRAIDGFSAAVIDGFGSQVPEQCQRYLQKIRKGAQRMDALINDLLTFSQLSRQAVRKREIDTEELVRGTLVELGSPWANRQVTIHLENLPVSLGDQSLLKQVWINLLSNALKYTGKREHTVIEIGCKVIEGEETFFVRDNGCGFDMRYANKLFGVFERLHRVEEYAGTGVGLAIVQRIIQRHGGRIWAEAAVDHGAAFFFNLGGAIPASRTS